MTEISNDNAEYIDEAVRRGAYHDQSEALNEAIGLLRKRDQLRADVMAGIAEADNGQLLPADAVFDRLEERARQIEEDARTKQ